MIYQTTRERIQEFTLTEIAWQKNLPMHIFDEMEADGWRCYDIYTAIKRAKENGNSEYKFIVYQTSVSAQVPHCYEINKFADQIANMENIAKWAKQLTNHLTK